MVENFVLPRVLLALVAPVLCGLAQTPVEKAQPSTTRYVNKSLGFEMLVPADWSYDRSGSFGQGGSLGLLRGAAPDGSATLQVLVFRDAAAEAFPIWIEWFTGQLSAIAGVQRVSVEGVQDAQPPAAYLSVRSKLGAQSTRSLYYCVRFDERTVLVIMHAAVGRSEAKAQPGDNKRLDIPEDFRQFVGTLKILFDPELADAFQTARQAGLRFLRDGGFAKAVQALPILEETRYYELESAGKKIGFLTRRVTRERRSLDQHAKKNKGSEGLRVHEESWRFAPDGSTGVNRTDLFSSDDRRSDLFEFWNAGVPAPGVADEPITSRDQCIRERDVLFSSLTSSDVHHLPDPRPPLTVESGYLGLGWVRMLPALLRGAAEEMIAFTIYDSETRTLITYAITPRGKRRLPRSPGRDAWLYETREGFAESPALLYADENGYLLRLEVGDLVVRLVDEQVVRAAYERRRQACQQRIKNRRK